MGIQVLMWIREGRGIGNGGRRGSIVGRYLITVGGTGEVGNAFYGFPEGEGSVRGERDIRTLAGKTNGTEGGCKVKAKNCRSTAGQETTRHPLSLPARLIVLTKDRAGRAGERSGRRHTVKKEICPCRQERRKSPPKTARKKEEISSIRL